MRMAFSQALEYQLMSKRVRRMRRTGGPRGAPRIDSEQANACA